MQNLQTQLNTNPQYHLHAFPLKKEQLNFNLRPEIPPWLAYSGPPSSIFSTRLDEDFSQTQHRQQDLSLLHESPNPNPSLGPTLPAYQPAPSPHMSATALLQKAAQMGATITKTGSSTPAMIRTHQLAHVPDPADSSAGTNSISSAGNFGLNLSSREAAVLLPPSASSAATTSTTAAASSGGVPSSFLLHDVMSSFSGATSGFEGTSFEDAFGGILNSKATTAAGHLGGAADDGGGCGGNEGLTRDFLGLRPLSHNEIFSIAGIGNCMSPSSHDQHNQSQKPWQG